MGRNVRFFSALAAGVLAFVVGKSTAHAALALTQPQHQCQVAIGKESVKFISGVLKLRQKCVDASLKAGGPGTCASLDIDDLNKLRTKLDNGLAKKCTFPTNTPGNLAALGFPGPCSDPNTLDKFTLADLQLCMRTNHEALLGGVCDGGGNAGEPCVTLATCPDQGPGTSCSSVQKLEYDPDITGPLDAISGTAPNCQKALATASSKYLLSVLKSLQKCRNDLLDCDLDLQSGDLTCKLAGFQASQCATALGPDLIADKCSGGTNSGGECVVASECPGGGTCVAKVKFANQKTIDALAKAKSKAEATITAKCPDADVVALQACEPDPVLPATGAGAATCETTAHLRFADNPDPTALYDFLDYEYATRGRCGDNRLNQGNEECDGTDDDACPGLCGSATGYFACLCQDIPRTRVIEHSNADLDNGWSGQSHDSGIVEGGGYVTDLWDCDGPGGPDTLCNVGPSCSLAPHSRCNPPPCTSTSCPAGPSNANTICSGLGQGTCRKSGGGATGPHCEIDTFKRCETDAHCTTLGDRCLHVNHGSPLPLSSGGVSVCVLNIFSEDVVGTTDLATGAGSVRLRQISLTHLGPDPQQPCPVCGGFCSGAGGATGPGVRNLCNNDGDCSGGATCITDPVCSWGPKVDLPCRPNPPFGGGTAFFGNPSVDCPPAGGANISGNGLDILFNEASTTAASPLTANVHCGLTGFQNKVCAGGSSNHRPCTVASECPGGSCNEQCFCSPDDASQRPNACEAACLGGTDDGQPCIDNSECALPGFCHNADCRLNGSDTDSTQEGICTVGPVDGTCSIHSFKTCGSDAGCQDPLCPFCDLGETCVFNNRQCFVNPTITRGGAAGVPNRISAATFCIAKTSAPSVNSVAGLPGPGAITQPATTTEVGF